MVHRQLIAPAPLILPRVDPTEVEAWRQGLRGRAVVVGDSMLPTLADGDEVLHRLDGRFEIGDIVVAHHPLTRDVMLIKQVAAGDEHRVRVLGLNPRQSTDSRSFGAVARALIVGRVTCRLPPEEVR